MSNEIIINILKQFLLFSVITIVGSWVGFTYVFKNSDWKTTYDDMEKARNEDNVKKYIKLEKRMKFIDLQFKVQEFLIVLRSWTLGLVFRVICLLACLVTTFQFPKVKIKVCDENDAEEGIDGEMRCKGELYFKIIPYFSDRGLNVFLGLFTMPIFMFVASILRIVFMFLPMLLGFGLIHLLLPSTFASVALGLERWMELLNAPISLDLFSNVKDIFVDIAWNKLVIGGINENAILFIAIALYFIVFAASTFCELFDINGKMVSGNFMFFVYTTLFVVAFNMVWGVLSPMTYIAISNTINSVGMICAFFLSMHIVIQLIDLAPRFILKKIKDKTIDKIKALIK